MATPLLLIDVKNQDQNRILAHLGRIVSNTLNVFGQTSQELLESRAIPAAKRELDLARVNYKGLLRNSFVVLKADTPSGRAYTLKNTQPYAYSINTGIVPKSTWSDSSSSLKSWREAKGIRGGDPNFVVVGQSGGGNRVANKPYPSGVHFMEAGFQSILGDLTPTMQAALKESMR